MKHRLFIIASFLIAGLAFTSCIKDGPDYTAYYPNAIVTVKNSPEGEFYFQLDDKTVVKPTNITRNPYDKEVRALVTIGVEGPWKGDVKDIKIDHAVYVYAMDSIRTKSTSPSLGLLDDKTYGDAPIEILNEWCTLVEDNYLTVSFLAYWGNPNEKHEISLVRGADATDPYTVVLHHNTLNDVVSSNRREMRGTIAFKLDELPSTNGETVKLKVRYNSLIGEKTISFDYKN